MRGLCLEGSCRLLEHVVFFVFSKQPLSCLTVKGADGKTRYETAEGRVKLLAPSPKASEELPRRPPD